MAITIMTSVDILQVPVGGTATFGVRLSAKPRRTVKIEVEAKEGDDDIRLFSGNKLRFSSNNWDTYQYVTVQARPDDSEGDSTRTIQLKPSGGLPKKYVKAVAVSDDDSEPLPPPSSPPAVKVDTTSATVAEGQSASFKVSLSAAPSADLTVTATKTGGDANIYAVSGKTMTFTPQDWSTPQTLTIYVADDGEMAEGSASFSIGGGEATPVTVSVSELNTTPQKILVDKTALEVQEGGSAEFQVKLSARPAGNVTVSAVKISGDSDFSVTSGAQLVFTPENFASYQKVAVTTVNDMDSTDDTAVIRVSAPGAAAADVTATEIDTTPVSTGTVTIDPVTRIEGHLKIETRLESGRVADAQSTATLYRGIEQILQGRDPRDAPLITQRLCGVCTYIHMLTSSRCLEDAFGVAAPGSARMVRNLLLGAQYVHDHVVHFYHLNAMDWVDLSRALEADPSATDSLARTVSPWAPAIDFAAVKDRLAGLVGSGQLGPFKNAYFGHPDYRFSPEESLLLVAHYLTALRKQAEMARMMAILGGKNPHPQSVVAGGVTCGSEMANPSRLDDFQALMASAVEFVDTVYMPDVMILAAKYPDWASIGGFDNLLSYGEFPLGPSEPDDLFLPRGAIFGRNWADVRSVDVGQVTEHVAHSWYSGTADRHPFQGETDPQYSDPAQSEKYSWLKAPRYAGKAMEVGPLARVMVAYGAGHPETVAQVDEFLSRTNLGVEQMFSTLGRTAARAIETKVIADAMADWLSELETNLNAGDNEIFKNYSIPSTGQGFGLNEAPRGALGHWTTLENKRIKNYQMVVPSTWNFGPRDRAGLAGPVEQALVGTPVADPTRPVELLRVLHSFDPCIACGVHVIDAAEGTSHVTKVL